MVPPPAVSQDLTLASNENMQSGEPAAWSASPRATSVLRPAPAGICISQSSLASFEAKTILDSHRTPSSLGSGQLLPPLRPQKQAALSALLLWWVGPMERRGLMEETRAMSYKWGEGQ